MLHLDSFIDHHLVFNEPLRKREITKYCIFHHSGLGWNTVEEIHEGQKKEKGMIGIAYNLIVYEDGTIHIGRPEWACDADCYGHNDDSLSVCFVGDFDKNQMSLAQIKSGIEIMKWAVSMYPNIIGIPHRELNSTSCPGKNFQDKIIFEGMIKMDKITNVDEALKILLDNKIINDIAFRKKVCDTVTFETEFVLNVANFIVSLPSKQAVS